MQLLWSAVFSIAVIWMTVSGQKKCRPGGDPQPSEVPLTTEPISQIRTIAGSCRADIPTCPMSSCRYDTRLGSKCPLDGVWCPQKETRKVDCDSLGAFEVDFVTSCTCCQSEGIEIKGYVLDSEDRSPIPRVLLRMNRKIRMKSGSDGGFSALVPPGTTRVIITAALRRGNYIATNKVIDIPVGTSGPISVTMYMVRLADPIQIDSDEDNEIPLMTSKTETAMIGIRGGSFQTKRGAYTGMVMASVNYIDTSNRTADDVIPGRFVTGRGRQINPLVSDGIFALSFKGERGEALKVEEAVVRVRSGMRLWTLSTDGSWKPLSGTTSRRRRQIELTDEFIVAIDSAQWINIDRIPGAPTCYYKARVFDEITDVEIVSSGTASFRPESVGYTTLNQRLQFYHPFTSAPATNCFEVRCPNISDPSDTLIGLIGMKAYESVLIGGVYFPFTTTLKPRELVDYDPALLPRLGFVQYATLPSDQIYVNYISDPAGPFYTSMAVCESSTIDEASFHFLKPELPSYLPVPDDTQLCTARVGFFDEGNFFDGIDQCDLPFIVNTLSTWEMDGTAYYYTDTSAVACSDIGGEFLYVCIKYRCSTDDAITTVRVDIDIPMIEANGTDSEKPAFYCQASNCVTDDCNRWGSGGSSGVSIDGSFEAPVGIGNGPDFFLDSPNDCADRSANEPFALTFNCYTRGVQ